MKEIDELRAINEALAEALGSHGEPCGWRGTCSVVVNLRAALALLPGLQEKLETFQARLTNEIGLRVLTEILLEEATGKSVKGDSPVPSADDLPGLLKYSMQETRATQDALGEVMQRAEAAESQLAEARAELTRGSMKEWLTSPAFSTFVDLKHGAAGEVLTALQDGAITRSRAAEVLAEIAHGAKKADLPEYRVIFSDEEVPADVVTDLRSQLAEKDARIAGQWRLFDTAPEDGSEVLVWRKDAGVFVASYQETADGEDYAWFTVGGYDDLSGGERPTHWMPLPSAPESGKPE